MPSITLFESGGHRNVLLEDFGHGEMVQANQHLIVHNGCGMILDPGGHKVYNKALSQTMVEIGGGKLEYVFTSHQDPDIVAALNGWLMTTDATALAPEIWRRFIPHFGLDDLLMDRMKGIPDEGMHVSLGGADLALIPGHFLHSCGNFQIWDQTSKILYTGDLGASVGQNYFEVTDFDAHLQYMEGFHRRYMTSKRMMNAWVEMVCALPIEIIAPQHGAFFRGREMVDRFLTWCSDFECGVDFFAEKMILP